MHKTLFWITMASFVFAIGCGKKEDKPAAKPEPAAKEATKEEKKTHPKPLDPN